MREHSLYYMDAYGKNGPKWTPQKTKNNYSFLSKNFFLSYRNFHAMSDHRGTPPGIVKVHCNTRKTENGGLVWSSDALLFFSYSSSFFKRPSALKNEPYATIQTPNGCWQPWAVHWLLEFGQLPPDVDLQPIAVSTIGRHCIVQILTMRMLRR